MKRFAHRMIRDDPAFEAARRVLVPDDHAWEELRAGLDATIAETPTVGTRVGDTPFWLITTERAPGLGLARFRILYTFDDQSVDLIAIGRGD